MTTIALTIRQEDPVSPIEPIVGTGWSYRCRNSLPYVNAAGDRVDNSWPSNGGWKTFRGAAITLDLDPLPADNPYLLEVRRPGDPKAADPLARMPSMFSEFRNVLAGTVNGTSWWSLPQKTVPGADGMSYVTVSELLGMIQDLQEQVSAGVGGSGGNTVDNLPGMSANARTFNKAADYSAMRTALLGTGLTTVDDLTVSDDATVTGDLVVQGQVSIPDSALAVSKVAGLATALAGVAASPATTTAQGLVELATSAEAVTGTDTARAVTPAAAAALVADRVGGKAAKASDEGLKPGDVLYFWCPGGVQPQRSTVTTRTDIRVCWQNITSTAAFRSDTGYAIAGDQCELAP